MRHLDLFAGLGAFAHAANMVFKNHQIVGFSEIEKNCISVYKRHYPNAENIGDARNFNGKHLCGTIDLATAGTPCQNISVAGNREGLAGEQSRLFFEFHRIVTEVLPRWIIFENVKELLYANEGRDFAIVLGAFTGIIPEVPEIGWGNAGLARGNFYQVAYRVFDAQFSGVPQRRQRVFIVASIGNGSCAEVLFESESDKWNSKKGRKTREKASRYSAFSAENSSTAYGIAHTVDGTPPLRAANSGTNQVPTVYESFNQSGFCYFSEGLGTLKKKGGDLSVGGENIIVSRPLSTKSHIGTGEKDNFVVTFDPRNVTSKVNRTSFENGNPSNTLHTCAPVVIAATLNNGGNQGGFRMEPGEHLVFDWQSGGDCRLNISDEKSSALQAHQTKALCNNIGIRRLTPLECERLMGLPDNFTKYDADGKEISDTARYHMIGNSIAIPDLVWMMHRIKAIDARGLQ